MKTCNTCEKQMYNRKAKKWQCVALNVEIGTMSDCFAWTNDPEWLKKVQKAVRLYQTGKGER